MKYQIFILEMSLYLEDYPGCDWPLIAIGFMHKEKTLSLVYQTLNYNLSVYSEVLAEYCSVLVFICKPSVVKYHCEWVITGS